MKCNSLRSGPRPEGEYQIIRNIVIDYNADLLNERSTTGFRTIIHSVSKCQIETTYTFARIVPITCAIGNICLDLFWQGVCEVVSTTNETL